MPFKIVKPKRRYNHSHLTHKHLDRSLLGDLIKSEGSTNGNKISRIGKGNSGEEISLEEYCKNSERELTKYNLWCTCDNLAGGIINDRGAMHDAHVTLTLDLLEPLEKWAEKDDLEHRMAMQLQAETNNGLAKFDFEGWEEMKNDKDKLGKMFIEARRELLEFESNNENLFCGMTVGRTSEERKYWRNLKITSI